MDTSRADVLRVLRTGPSSAASKNWLYCAALQNRLATGNAAARCVPPLSLALRRDTHSPSCSREPVGGFTASAKHVPDRFELQVRVARALRGCARRTRPPRLRPCPPAIQLSLRARPSLLTLHARA